MIVGPPGQNGNCVQAPESGSCFIASAGAPALARRGFRSGRPAELSPLASWVSMASASLKDPVRTKRYERCWRIKERVNASPLSLPLPSSSLCSSVRLGTIRRSKI
jgi:hypothetical protein